MSSCLFWVVTILSQSPLPPLFYINTQFINHLEPGGAFQLLSTTHPWVTICRHNGQQGLAYKTTAHQQHWEKWDRNRNSLSTISFYFLWTPGVILEHKGIRNRDRGYLLIQTTHHQPSISSPRTLLPCHHLIQGEEQNTGKGNSLLFSKQCAFFPSIQIFLLSCLISNLQEAITFL